jgi:hypothetical protein
MLTVMKVSGKIWNGEIGTNREAKVWLR